MGERAEARNAPQAPAKAVNVVVSGAVPSNCLLALTHEQRCGSVLLRWLGVLVLTMLKPVMHRKPLKAVVLLFAQYTPHAPQAVNPLLHISMHSTQRLCPSSCAGFAVVLCELCSSPLCSCSDCEEWRGCCTVGVRHMHARMLLWCAQFVNDLGTLRLWQDRVRVQYCGRRHLFSWQQRGWESSCRFLLKSLYILCADSFVGVVLTTALGLFCAALISNQHFCHSQLV